jgi:hypothetical protein
MTDFGQDVNFTLEVFACLIISSKVFVKDLNRDLPILIERMTQEDLAHPSFVNLLDDSVLAEKDPVWHAASLNKPSTSSDVWTFKCTLCLLDGPATNGEIFCVSRKRIDLFKSGLTINTIRSQEAFNSILYETNLKSARRRLHSWWTLAPLGDANLANRLASTNLIRYECR